MSLLLRKKCQDLLDNVGLDVYHIQVDPDTKYLQVAGECGQSLVTIEGIRLSKMAPAPAEIELALELFDAFLAKHTVTFRDFIAAKQISDTCPKPECPGLLKATVNKNSYQDFHLLSFNMINWPDSSVSVQSNGIVTLPSRAVKLHKNPDETLCLALTPKEDMLVRDWIAGFNEYTAAVKAKEDALAKLSSCEI